MTQRAMTVGGASMRQVKHPEPLLSAAQLLNRDCTCAPLDSSALAQALGGPEAYAWLRESRPHLFSDVAVYTRQAELAQVFELIRIVEDIVAMPAWQERVLAWAPASALRPCAARGAFLGYDFHLGESGPKLIEINTNAGGGMLNAKLLTALSATCYQARNRLKMPTCQETETAFMAMFREEWQRERGAQTLARLAIVDEQPETQYLAPEFELFRQLFEDNGLRTVIADPAEFSWDGSRLMHAGEMVDLVYNRLTDFALDAPNCAALRSAWEQGAVVITPHPRAHALYADKRNLVLLSDPYWLAEIGLAREARALIAAMVPTTVMVDATQAERFWAERKQWFFKPAAGYGSKAAYRGDKLTRRVFGEILQGDYVAQTLIPPAERRRIMDGVVQQFKFDLRCYAYAGRVQLTAARLYQGQTTNFRTPGGGFAPVIGVEESVLAGSVCP